jgi:hypothetical protein
MNRSRTASLALLVALLMSAGCSNDLMGPSADPVVAQQAPDSADTVESPALLLGGLLGGTLGTVTNTLNSTVSLLTCSSLPYRKTTKTIGAEGGTITVGEHQLVVPRGALKRKVTITAEQMSGRANSVRFSPEGLHFERPTELTLSYANCLTLPLPKRIAYTDERLNILELLFSRDARGKRTVTGPVDHFSRYAVAY